jgi:hypothetical protein
MVFEMVFFQQWFFWNRRRDLCSVVLFRAGFFLHSFHFKKIGFNVLSLAAEKLEARKEHNLTKRTA